MTCVQRNVWLCDICGAEHVTVQEVLAYDDPVVNPPPGWDPALLIPAEFQVTPLRDCADACPACLENPDWKKYADRNRKVAL